MKKFILILVLPVLFFSCAKKNSIPADVLPPEKMEAIMWDMMRADQFLTDYVFSKDPQKDKDKESVVLYKKILSIHQVSKDEFQRSITYYKNHPKQLAVVLDSIQNNKQAGQPSYLPATPIETKPADTTASRPQTTTPPVQAIRDSLRAKGNLSPIKAIKPD